MRKYLPVIFLLALFSTPSAGDMIVVPPGGGTGIYVPGFRTYSANWYRTSPENLAALDELRSSAPKLKIAGFGAESPGETSRVCRLSFPVQLPTKMAYEVYLAEAMRAELLEAGLYSDDAQVALKGHLLSMDFNSFGTGKWTIEARFSAEGKEPITIKHEHTFPVSITAVAACGDVTRALVPALQGFLLAAYKDVGFKGLIQAASSPTPNSDPPKIELPEPGAGMTQGAQNQ